MGYGFWTAIVATAFFFGILLGATVERKRGCHVAADKGSLVYGDVAYVRVLEGTRIEDYLIATVNPPKRVMQRRAR